MATKAEIPILIWWFQANYPDLALKNTPPLVASMVRDIRHRDRTCNDFARL